MQGDILKLHFRHYFVSVPLILILIKGLKDTPPATSAHSGERGHRDPYEVSGNTSAPLDPWGGLDGTCLPLFPLSTLRMSSSCRPASPHTHAPKTALCLTQFWNYWKLRHPKTPRETETEPVSAGRRESQTHQTYRNIKDPYKF